MMRTILPVLVAVLTGLAACSRDAGPDATAGEPGAQASTEGTALDACPMLTAEDITAVMGKAPGTPERTPGRFAATCKWPGGDGLDPELVHVFVTTGSAVSSFEDYDRRGRAAMKGRFANTPIQKIEGFGDFAVWAGDEQSGALQVFEGGRLVQVTVSRIGDRTALDVARELMGRLRAKG